jgi:hypothetical protein
MGIIGIGNRFRDRTTTVFGDNTRQSVVIIPGVLGEFSRRNVSSTGSVPLIVVSVSIGTVGEQSVILSGLISCIGAVPIRIISVGFIRLIAMVRTRKLVAIVVVVVTRSIGRDEL